MQTQNTARISSSNAHWAGTASRWQMRRIWDLLNIWHVLVLQNYCRSSSYSVQETLLWWSCYRAWFSMLAYRYSNSNKLRTTGWGQFFGNHDVCDDCLSRNILYINDNYCRWWGACYAKGNYHWRREGQEDCWQFVALQCVQGKSITGFLHCEKCVAAHGWSDVVRVKMDDEPTRTIQHIKSVSHHSGLTSLVVDSTVPMQ